MSASETLGAIGIIVAVFALALAGLAYNSIPDTDFDTSKLEKSINQNTADLLLMGSSVSTLDNSDQTLLNRIQNLEDRRDSGSDLDNVEDDVNDNQRDLNDILDCANDYVDDNESEDWFIECVADI